MVCQRDKVRQGECQLAQLIVAVYPLVDTEQRSDLLLRKIVVFAQVAESCNVQSAHLKSIICTIKK